MLGEFQNGPNKAQYNDHLLELIDQAISKNEMIDFLKGNDNYFIPSRDGRSTTDVGAALYSGIHKYYVQNPCSSIKQLFVNAIEQMLSGTELEIMIAFEYLYLQLLAEIKNNSPFELDKACYEKLGRAVTSNADKLKQYKDNADYGSLNPNGAYEYIENIAKYFKDEYGRDIISL